MSNKHGLLLQKQRISLELHYISMVVMKQYIRNVPRKPRIFAALDAQV